MDKALKSKWLSALRGAEYQQAHGSLRQSGPSFCCLGVLLEVAKRGAWDDEERQCYRIDDDTLLEGDLGSYRRELGVTLEHETHLVNMNDGAADFLDNPQPFSVIADYIEKNL